MACGLGERCNPVEHKATGVGRQLRGKPFEEHLVTGEVVGHQPARAGLGSSLRPGDELVGRGGILVRAALPNANLVVSDRFEDRWVLGLSLDESEKRRLPRQYVELALEAPKKVGESLGERSQVPVGLHTASVEG